MLNYQHAKIYKITSPHTDEIYIGSTCKTLEKALYNHLAYFKHRLIDIYAFHSSFNIFLADENSIIELIKLYPCNNKYELDREKGRIIKENKNAINKVITGRNATEYRNDNRDKFKEYHRQYYLKKKLNL